MKPLLTLHLNGASTYFQIKRRNNVKTISLTKIVEEVQTKPKLTQQAKILLREIGHALNKNSNDQEPAYNLLGRRDSQPGQDKSYAEQLPDRMRETNEVDKAPGLNLASLQIKTKTLFKVALNLLKKSGYQFQKISKSLHAKDPMRALLKELAKAEKTDLRLVLLAKIIGIETLHIKPLLEAAIANKEELKKQGIKIFSGLSLGAEDLDYNAELPALSQPQIRSSSSVNRTSSGPFAQGTGGGTRRMKPGSSGEG